MKRDFYTSAVTVWLVYSGWTVRERMLRFATGREYLQRCYRYHPNNPQRRHGYHIAAVWLANGPRIVDRLS